jgi:hypothetical protein
MLGWLYLFGVGMLIDSKPFREALTKTIDWYVLFGAILTFTPTNVALLAIVAGFLGGCASLLMYSDYEPTGLAKQNGKRSIELERLAYLQENPISSALRGFIVYLTFLAGTVFSATGAFAATTQDQYCRLAGAVAVFSRWSLAGLTRVLSRTSPIVHPKPCQQNNCGPLPLQVWATSLFLPSALL